MNARSLLAYCTILTALAAMFCFGSHWASGCWPWAWEAKAGTWQREPDFSNLMVVRNTVTDERRVWFGGKGWSSLGSPAAFNPADLVDEKEDQKLKFKRTIKDNADFWCFWLAMAMFAAWLRFGRWLDSKCNSRIAWTVCMVAAFGVITAALFWCLSEPATKNPVSAEEFLRRK